MQIVFKRNTTDTDFGMYDTVFDSYHVQYSCYADDGFISKHRCAGLYANTGSWIYCRGYHIKDFACNFSQVGAEKIRR